MENKNIKPILTQEYVKTLFDYKDGFLYWKIKGKGIPYGKVAGTAGKQTYGYQLSVRINQNRYLIHRIIFLWHNGYTPVEIDHIDRNNLNNIIENLRPATRSQNNCNQRSRNGSTSKFLGVHLKYAGKWTAMIRIKGKQTYLGCFNDEKLAALAYNEAAKTHHGEFANLNQI